MNNWVSYLLQVATLLISLASAIFAYLAPIRTAKIQAKSQEKIKDMELSYAHKEQTYRALCMECDRYIRGISHSQADLRLFASQYLPYCSGRSREKILAFIEKTSAGAASCEEIARITVDITDMRSAKKQRVRR